MAEPIRKVLRRHASVRVLFGEVSEGVYVTGALLIVAPYLFGFATGGMSNGCRNCPAWRPWS